MLLTHHHHDHAALAHNIRCESECKLIVHKNEINYITTGTTYTNKTKQFNKYLKLIDKIFSPFIQYNYTPVSLTETDIVICDDSYDIFKITGIKGKIVHTPGHSNGSISLLLPNGDAFVGDVAMNMLKVFGHKYRPVEAENYSEIYESWRKLIDFGAINIYPSHGNSFSIEGLKKILKII